MAQPASCGGSQAFTVLHFTKTNGFDHRTRDESAAMFTEIGVAGNFTVTDSEDAAVFDDLSALMSYEVIIFSNTSGDDLLNAGQQANVEAYIAGGGAFLGIHAATDTERSRNWAFYNDLVGGIVQSGPNHTANNFQGTMDHVGTHPSTANVPDPWMKTEEYYYWERNGGMLDPDIVPVLRVRETMRNNTVSSYDAPRPISWYQTFDGGARSFYTALGHAAGNYTDATNDFRRHLRDALCWTVLAEPVTLPVAYLGSRLTPQPDGTHLISWEVAGDLPVRVELHGGTTPEQAALLSASDRPGATGSLAHRPASLTSAYHYRLRFVDPDGRTSWGEWHLAAAARPALSVTYDNGRPGVVNGTDSPVNVALVDAGGRVVRGITLYVGRTELTGLAPGVYFVGVPFGEQVKVVVGR